MRIKESRKVHIDHHIPRESIRFLKRDDEKIGIENNNMGITSPYIRYTDIYGEWFSRIRKPDFQRETNAWSPEECLELIDSVFHKRIIPSIILWRNEETGLIYVLDGAHRLSVIRAWMTNDWGDKRISYYERRDTSQIKKIANETRNLINREIGSFDNFKHAHDILKEYTNKGKAPKLEMPKNEFLQATFYSDVVTGNLSLLGQWEQGDYNSAEQSFLRINKQGQPLNPWETTLIEYRKSSYARVLNSVANAGKDGHFWPIVNVDKENKELISTFSAISREIFEKLFEPPFKIPINSLSVPMMVAPAYFQKHQYLFEIIPLVVHNELAFTAKDQISRLNKDQNSDANDVVRNGSKLLDSLNSKLEHLESFQNSSKSLALVPLFYWYNARGQYVRGLLYGFIGWILSGTEQDIKNKKLLFSAVRGRFEEVLFYYKHEFASLARNTGAGLKSVRKLTKIFHQLVNYLVLNQQATQEEVEDKLYEILGLRKSRPKFSSSKRIFSSRDKTQINIREYFDQSIRCHICGGIVNISKNDVQYDHVNDYQYTKTTDPDDGKPTHPFCNNMKRKINEVKDGDLTIPSVKFDLKEANDKKDYVQQLDLFMDEDEFPE